MTCLSRTCWILDPSAIGSQYHWGVQPTFTDGCVYSLHGRKSPDISLFKEHIIATICGVSDEGARLPMTTRRGSERPPERACPWKAARREAEERTDKSSAR